MISYSAIKMLAKCLGLGIVATACAIGFLFALKWIWPVLLVLGILLSLTIVGLYVMLAFGKDPFDY